jgi:hypothetical protein
MTFDPKAHLIQLPRRVKDPNTGHFTTRQDDYLEVKWRLVWFREKYPHGCITTEEMCIDLDQGYARFKATAGDGEGGMATGTGTEMRKSFEDFVEKAETRAIGRALAALGIGTQFVGEELSEGEHVADAPVQGGRSSAPIPPPAGEVIAQGPTEKHPTADEISTLVESARAANVDLEAFGHDMRRLMKLPESQKITKKFLRETMTVTQYNTARAHYGEALRVILEEDVPTHEPPSEAGEASTPETVHAAVNVPAALPPTRESLPAVPPLPPASSSAPEPDPNDAAERDRQRLRAEVAKWDLRVSQAEIEHILTHHPFSRARTLLWQARTKAPAATPIEDAAD